MVLPATRRWLLAKRPGTHTNTIAMMRMITATMYMNIPTIITIIAPTINHCC